MVESNLLEDFILDKNAGNAKKKPEFEDSDYDDEEEEDFGECDPNGDIAVCEDCSKIVPKSKLSLHQDYYCKNKMAECPICFERYPMMMIEEHMTHCTVVNQDPNLVTCKVCGSKMDKKDLPDHAIAHTIHQKQIETQSIIRVVEQQEFFEEEKLEIGTNEPTLKAKDLLELPTKVYERTPETQG